MGNIYKHEPALIVAQITSSVQFHATSLSSMHSSLTTRLIKKVPASKKKILLLKYEARLEELS